MDRRSLKSGLVGLPFRVRRRLLATSDALAVALAAFLALTIAGAGALRTDLLLWLTLGHLTMGATLSVWLGLRLIKLTLFEASDVVKIGRAIAAMTLVHLAATLVAGVPSALESSLLFASLSFGGLVCGRSLGAVVLSHARASFNPRRPVGIFGAGVAGVQMAIAVRQSQAFRPAVFFDDNPMMHGMEIGGLQVLPQSDLARMAASGAIERLIITLPDSANERRDALISLCADIGLEAQVIPPFADMLTEAFSNPRKVDPQDLLGRRKVDLETPDIAATYAGKVVMVTGAGGSIGSELCRQLLNCRPAKLVFFDHSEFNLYDLDQRLHPLAAAKGVTYSCHLGSVTNAVRVEQIIREEAVQVIFHAAAYKHVPMVEDNVVEGVANNVFGTRIVAEAALAAQVERMILVSSDKAVRPTNIMGATKRLSEIIVQDLQSRSRVTKFSMVRFGNVLGSSGSVLPLFLNQITSGGPVTVTHPDVKRYFMTVSEAVRLVLLAGSYSEGGDLFVLDMGEPQSILTIAEKLVSLSGLSVKDPVTGQGDIEIKITGLRPGEKLIEELFISSRARRSTEHPKIFRAEEGGLSQIEVAALLRELQQAVFHCDTERLRRIIERRMTGYRPTKLVANG